MIPWTLQRYIAKEMGKTFALTAIGLMAVLGLGGGVVQMVQLGGELSPTQLVRLLWLVLPVALALTLPMAALFSAASTYGRLSADNEFVACRAGGINLLVLLAPPLVLSVVCALVTFAFFNFLIPRLIRDMDELVTSDIAGIVQQRLNRPRGIGLADGRYRLCADGTRVEPTAPNRLQLQHVAFVELDGDAWGRVGTARQVALAFRQGDPGLRVSARMFGLSYYDPVERQIAQVDEFDLGTDDLPAAVPPQLKFLTLADLLRYRADPMSWREVQDAFVRLRRDVSKWMVREDLLKQWQAGGAFALEDHDTRWTVAAKTAVLSPAGEAVELTQVTVHEVAPRRERTIEAERGLVEWKGLGATAGVELQLFNTRLHDGSTVRERPRDTIGPIAIPEPVRARADAMSTDELLVAGKVDGATDPLAKSRAAAVERQGDVIRRVRSIIHERAAFSVSVMVLVVLGAGLAIILRGAQLITAFGISFIPSAVVLVGIVAGKQLLRNDATETAGLAVLWGGIALVGALDVWTLARWLRR